MNESNRLLWAGICFGLFAGTAGAQTITQNFRQTGNLIGASATVTGANYQANVNVSPGVPPGSNQEMYVVIWSVTAYGGSLPPIPPCVVPPPPPPLPPDMISITVSGFVAASALQRLPSGGLTVDLDIGKLQQQFVSSVQCINGACTQKCGTGDQAPDENIPGLCWELSADRRD